MAKSGQGARRFEALSTRLIHAPPREPEADPVQVGGSGAGSAGRARQPALRGAGGQFGIGQASISTQPEGAKLLAVAKAGDVIVAAKLDRVFRSALDALQMVEELQ